MKKIIILLLLPLQVYAKTLYTEYSDYSNWTEEKYTSSDLVFVEEEKRYKFYINERTNLGYIEDYENKYKIDKEDFIYTPFTEFSLDAPKEQKNRTIEEKSFYKYKEVNKVNKILLSNLYGSEDCFRITEIVVSNNNSKIAYTPSCTKCNASNLKYLYNSKTKENMFYVVNGGTITLNLNGYYNIQNISIKLYLYDRENTVKKYKISFLNDKEYFKKSYEEKFKSDYLTPNLFEYFVNDTWINTADYSSYLETEEYINKTFYRIVETFKKYRYTDLIYMKYLEERKYYDDNYYTNIEGYIKDEFEYKVFYRKKERKKIETNEGKTTVEITETKNEEKQKFNKEKIKTKTLTSKINYKLIILITLILLLIIMILV